MKKLIWLIFLAALLALPTFAQDRYSELVEKAMEYTKLDSLVQAEELYREALKLDPNNARNALLFSNLGTVLNRQGRREEAIEAYTFALNITPYSTAMLLNRAALYLDSGLFDKAYIDYCNVIDLIPEETEARIMRAYIYIRRRDYMDARIDYNVVLSNDGTNKTARLGVAILDEKEGRFKAAADGISLLITEYPDDPSLLKMRANIYIEQGYNDLALLDLEEAASLDPSDPDIFLTMGDTCLKLKLKSEARNAYEKAISLGIARQELAEQLRQCK